MSSTPSIYFSVQEFCKSENLEEETLKKVAVDVGRKTIREIAKDHDIASSTVQKYKNKLKNLSREDYIIIMNDIYQQEVNRALLHKNC